MTRQYRGRAWWDATRRRLYDRQAGRCQLCGKLLLDTHEVAAHHRKARSQGGTDHDVNLILLHGWCHRDVHNHPTAARSRGLILESWQDETWSPLLPPVDMTLAEQTVPGSDWGAT